MKHLACIMDGNRRWAKQHKLQALLGHRQGAESIQRVIDFCLKNRIKYLSLYTFSIENFNRSKEECTYLFDLISTEVKNRLDDFIKYKIRVRFIGDRSLFPKSVKPAIDEIEAATQHLDALHINFLFCYGSRQEIIGGIKSLVKKVKDGLISEDDISEDLFNQHLWTADIPDPDLIVRTGGVVRLSNFLLYQAAYSEFYFLDCFWPEISEQHLQGALNYFNECKRNFGS